MDTKALRQKILDLAIRGKLVPQDPNDEPAEVLLERIREQKQQMLKEGKLKKKDIKNDTIIFKGEDNLHYEKFQDGTIKCIEDEIPFEVPEGWAWARLRDICMMSAGKSKSTDQIKSEPFEESYPCFGGNGVRGYVDEYNQDGIFSIVGRQGALCGNINIAIGKFYATEHAVVTTLFDGIDFKWSNYILEALRLNNYATGAAQPGLSVANILNVFVPVPPTQEQDRIGNNVYESLKIVEALEQEKIDLQKIIITAKTKILDLAIRGKLVPQDPNDEPASVLLERIRTEKEELIKQGKIKRDKKESVIFKGDDNSYYEKLPDEKINCIDKQLPFELPDGWKWCNLSMIGTTNIGLTYRPADIDTQGIIVLRSCNIVNDRINRTDLVRVKTSIRENQFVQKDDILICARNGSRSLVGKCALIPELAEKVSFGAFMAVYRTPYFSYIVHFLRSNFFRSVFDDSNSTAINQLTQDMLKRAVVPLPPLAEQLRIVDKITELFERLNCIEESLN